MHNMLKLRDTEVVICNKLFLLNRADGLNNHLNIRHITRGSEYIIGKQECPNQIDHINGWGLRERSTKTKQQCYLERLSKSKTSVNTVKLAFKGTSIKDSLIFLINE